jgi:hypothetical protein
MELQAYSFQPSSFVMFKLCSLISRKYLSNDGAFRQIIMILLILDVTGRTRISRLSCDAAVPLTSSYNGVARPLAPA